MKSFIRQTVLTLVIGLGGSLAVAPAAMQTKDLQHRVRHELESCIVTGQVRGEPALVADRGRQPLLAEVLADGVIGLDAHAHRMWKVVGVVF